MSRVYSVFSLPNPASNIGRRGGVAAQDIASCYRSSFRPRAVRRLLQDQATHSGRQASVSILKIFLSLSYVEESGELSSMKFTDMFSRKLIDKTGRLGPHTQLLLYRCPIISMLSKRLSKIPLRSIVYRNHHVCNVWSNSTIMGYYASQDFSRLRFDPRPKDTEQNRLRQMGPHFWAHPNPTHGPNPLCRSLATTNSLLCCRRSTA